MKIEKFITNFVWLLLQVSLPKALRMLQLLHNFYYVLSEHMRVCRFQQVCWFHMYQWCLYDYASLESGYQFIISYGSSSLVRSKFGYHYAMFRLEPYLCNITDRSICKAVFSHYSIHASGQIDHLSYEYCYNIIMNRDALLIIAHIDDCSIDGMALYHGVSEGLTLKILLYHSNRVCSSNHLLQFGIKNFLPASPISLYKKL